MHGTLQQKRNWPHIKSVPKKTIKAQPSSPDSPRGVPSEPQQGGRGCCRFSYFYCSFPSPQWSYFNQDEGKDIETYWRYYEKQLISKLNYYYLLRPGSSVVEYMFHNREDRSSIPRPGEDNLSFIFFHEQPLFT